MWYKYGLKCVMIEILGVFSLCGVMLDAVMRWILVQRVGDVLTVW